jgi:hypothetical protein
VSVLVPISHVVYPPDCLRKAIPAYARDCDIQIREQTGARSLVEIQIPGREPADERRAAPELLNYLLDISIEWHLGCEATRPTHGPGKV